VGEESTSAAKADVALNIDGGSGDLTVDLRDATGASLWSKKLHPRGR
jgi:hypothetical protein